MPGDGDPVPQTSHNWDMELLYVPGPRVTLRLLRHHSAMPWLAALTYALTTVLIAIAWAFGGLPAQTALEVVGAYRAINLALYATFRSGFNLRFRDPSLTRPQILIAITAIMYIVYQESETLLKAADAAMYTAKPT